MQTIPTPFEEHIRIMFFEDDENVSDDDAVEYEDEDDYLRQRRLKEEFRAIKGNDPTFTKLDIESNGEYHLLPGRSGIDYIDWKVLGRAIGRNTNLKEVNIHWCQREIHNSHFMDFLRGLALNRSIQKLSIAAWDHSNRDLTKAARAEQWNLLTLFFRENQAFECLELDLRWNVKKHRELISTLEGFHSLKEFKLSTSIPFDDRFSVDAVIDAVLTGHTGLRKLSVQGFLIGRRGCAALAKSNLIELQLRTTIDDEGASIFETDIVRNVTLNTLDIGPTRFGTESGRQQSILVAIPRCRVVKLVLQHSELTDATLQSLSNALLHNTTLKSLDLSGNERITPTGWVTFSNVLREHDTALETLDLQWNTIGNVGLNALADALDSNSRLKELDLGGIRKINATGWVTFPTFLRNPYSVLERLDLASTSLTNEGIAALTDVLLNNSRLKELNLGFIKHATIEGWRSVSTVLRSPNSALEKLILRGNHINDEIMIFLANALTNNSRLRVLDTASDLITSDGWAAFTHILCNNASILSTFNSNHTLQQLFESHEEFYVPTIPDDLASLLRMNSENTVSQAARLKIIKTHFSGRDINMQIQPFMDMDLSARHHVIAWMARDNIAWLYQFLLAKPFLLARAERKVGQKKRPYWSMANG